MNTGLRYSLVPQKLLLSPVRICIAFPKSAIFKTILSNITIFSNLRSLCKTCLFFIYSKAVANYRESLATYIN